jgi:hypothetical protein
MRNAASRDRSFLRSSIARAARGAQNASRRAEMKEGTTASRALRYCPSWRSNGDCTLSGATVDPLSSTRVEGGSGLSDGADDSGLAACSVLQ